MPRQARDKQCKSWEKTTRFCIGFFECDPPSTNLENLDRMKAELLPLSAALPHLKIHISEKGLSSDVVGFVEGVWDPDLKPLLLEKLREEFRAAADAEGEDLQ